MGYSKLYFGKDLDDLLYEDIENYFIEEKEESDKIEFKSYPKDFGKGDTTTERENTIIKVVASLLNSEGGIIIWGAPKGVKDENKKTTLFLGPLCPLDIFIEKDRFINRVADAISPSPSSIQFKALNKESNYVYIIEVEKSSYSPHQYKDRYFMRLDGQTKPAPHHYVEALFKKITFPKLEGYIRIDSVAVGVHEQQFRFTITIYIMNTSKFQNEFDLVCRVIVAPGHFLHSQIPLNTNYSNASELSLTPAKQILFFGELFERTETIVLPYKNIEDQEAECKVTLLFGGKNSPLIMSNYTVRLGSIPMQGRNYNSMLKILDENKYVHQISEDLGVNHRDQLKRLLGR
ncbi:MAG: ATP-binding protein [Ferruginibacter sp.]|nr:ATP-binding protein [Ferruginibacter sp.]